MLEVLSKSHESVQDFIKVESGKSNERHEQSTTTIVANALESVNASSREEHEATRRELEQMKEALAQIEQDMIRRDNELKELPIALGKVHSEREKKKLQERSNAVTVALCALVTIYENLQVHIPFFYIKALLTDMFATRE
jgi:hypothetical protein